MFSSKCRKSYSSRVWVGLSSVRWDETIMLILYDNSYHYWEHGFVRVRETRQSCSSLALPHKPTRPDSPDPIWRAGSWFSLLEVLVITVSRGTGYITARRCSYNTIIFTVQMYCTYYAHSAVYICIWLRLVWGHLDRKRTPLHFSWDNRFVRGRQWIGSPNRVDPLHILKYFGPQKKVSIISFEWYISMSLGLIPVGNKQNMR